MFFCTFPKTFFPMYSVRSSVGALCRQISALLRLRSYVGALMSALLCRRSIVVRSFDGVPFVCLLHRRYNFTLHGNLCTQKLVHTTNWHRNDIGLGLPSGVNPF